MERDTEGFLYPVVSDKCIHCGKCERVCPVYNPKEYEKSAGIAYAAVSKNAGIWQRSASGGAFSEICRAWSEEETLYAGAAWDGFQVHHICVKGFENIEPLCKSKYIASDIGNTYLCIKEHLDSGGNAVFCGTPCQVAGLRAYLGKEYEKLLMIDLICHGVGSPFVFAACIKALEKQLGKEIKVYTFRAKRKTHEADYLIKVTCEDDTEVYMNNDPYCQLFLSQMCLRPSCGKNCIYRSENRPGDITIADFKGLVAVFPELAGTKKNYSTIIFNNQQGQKVLAALQKSMHMRKCSMEAIKEYNPLFYKHTWFCAERDAFFADFTSSETVIDRWTENAKISKLNWKRAIYDSLPKKIRFIASAIVNKVKKNG